MMDGWAFKSFQNDGSIQQLYKAKASILINITFYLRLFIYFWFNITLIKLVSKL